MGTKQRSTLPLRVYGDFGPQYELLREEDEDALIVNLAGILFGQKNIGFRKDQLKVEINRGGTLEMTGERPLAGTKWSRFHREFHVADRSSLNHIRAKFENGLLQIWLPKPPTGKKAALTPVSYWDGKSKLVKLNLERYQPGELILALVLTVVASVGLGLYLHYKFN